MRAVFCACHNSAHMTRAVCLLRDGLVASEGTCRSALTDLSRQLTEQTKVYLGLNSWQKKIELSILDSHV